MHMTYPIPRPGRGGRTTASQIMAPETTQIEHARGVSRINHQDRLLRQNSPLGRELNRGRDQRRHCIRTRPGIDRVEIMAPGHCQCQANCIQFDPSSGHRRLEYPMGRDDHTTAPADCLTLVMPLQARAGMSTHDFYEYWLNAHVTLPARFPGISSIWLHAVSFGDATQTVSDGTGVPAPDGHDGLVRHLD